MHDQRLFHRYPAGLRVAFRYAGRGYRGKVINVSVGGGFVVTKAAPRLGSRVQMAAQQGRSQPTVWLDLRVTWLYDGSDPEQPRPGVGGYWLHASSRHGEDHLRGFLADVLGITKPVIRPMSPPSGGDVVYVYRFPSVYEGDELAELPWHEAREKPEVKPRTKRSGSRPKSGVRKRSSVRERKSSRAMARPVPEDSESGEYLVEPLPEDGPSSGSNAGPPAALTANTQMFMAEIPDDDSQSDIDPGVGADLSEAPPSESEESSGRWSFLVKKLSGIRTRQKPSGDVPADPVDVDIPEGSQPIKYQIGRKSFDAELRRIGSSWIVFRPTGKVPEVWSRIVVHIQFDPSKRSATLDVHATVTRLKKQDGDVPIVHCKINRVDENGNSGAYASYVDAFNARG